MRLRGRVGVLWIGLALLSLWTTPPAGAARATYHIADAVTCDGTTDRLAAIQGVLDGAGEGSTIVFPSADCYIVGTLSITKALVQNDNNHDEGDSQIADSLFTLPPAAHGIAWVSGGGLRVLNNKFLGGNIPLNIAPGPGVRTTGILLVTGNSFDWYGTAAVSIHTSGDSSFVLTSITANEFGGFVGGTAAVAVSGPNGLAYASTITGNTFKLTCLTRCEGTHQYGIALASGVQALVVANVFGGESGAVTAIRVEPAFIEAIIGENSFSLAFGAAISNASPTTRMKITTPLTWAAIEGALGAPRAGAEVWCDDCRGAEDPPYEAGGVCTGSGSGAVARRVGPRWRCW